MDNKTNKYMEKIEEMRHSLSHVLAAVVSDLFPGVKFGIGPAIENGFYYDFDFPETISQDDLPRIEEKMKEFLKKNSRFEKKEISKKEAEEIFKDQPYKLELLQEMEGEISTYENNGFVDLCKGPHVESTKKIAKDGFKLINTAGAYWKGSEKNKMLTRIYGIAFASKKELDDYLVLLEEAKKRDHRVLGKQLGIYAIYPEIGAGLPVWLPNGYRIRRTLEDYMIAMEREYGYEHILTPHIGKDVLFKTSGHLDFYKDSMYAPIEIDEETYYLKPMNCPMGIMVYKSEPRSYRDLPMKLGEFGTVYRYEKSGELSGLSRVRGFTQNDAHIFCTAEQLLDQFLEVFEMLQKFLKDLGFTNYRFRLGLGDPEKEKFKYCGTRENWEHAENTIRKALNKAKVRYYEAFGEAAFYGPKLDVQASDPLGREESISTIQIDFNLPEKFDLNYKKSDNQDERPFVIHRALIGSFERFFAFLIEFYAGDFPLWLSPLQVMIVPISEKQNGYAEEIKQKLKEKGITVEIDNQNRPMQGKLRNAQLRKIPYTLVIGEKEVTAKTVSVRTREKDLGPIPAEDFIEKVFNEIQTKKHI
ncbi:MAG: threonine--tRNA ligase [bacterium]